MLKTFHIEFTKDQLAVVFNFKLSELHKARVLHHWRLVGIPIISQEVKYAVANCHLCNHPFRNLHEVKESMDEVKSLFAAVTRKRHIEANRVIGSMGSAAAVTMLRDALLSTALYVCLACTAPVLGARFQRREAGENLQAIVMVALAGVARVVVLESEAISAGSMSVASCGQMATDSGPRRSERVTQQFARLLDAVEVACVAPTTPLRNVAYEREAVTTEMRAIGLCHDGKLILLNRVSALKGNSTTEAVPTRILSTDWSSV